MARPRNPRSRLYVPKAQGDAFNDEQNEWLMRQFRAISSTVSTLSDILLSLRQTWRDFSDSDNARLDTADVDTGWYVFPVVGGGATQPDMLEVVIPAGVGGDFTIESRVRVDNNTVRTGTAYLGVGIDGAAPIAGEFVTIPIPPNFIGNLDLVIQLSGIVPLPTDHVVTIWVRVIGDHSQFALYTDTTTGNHNLEVTLITV